MRLSCLNRLVRLACRRQDAGAVCATANLQQYRNTHALGKQPAVSDTVCSDHNERGYVRPSRTCVTRSVIMVLSLHCTDKSASCLAHPARRRSWTCLKDQICWQRGHCNQPLNYWTYDQRSASLPGKRLLRKANISLYCAVFGCCKALFKACSGFSEAIAPAPMHGAKQALEARSAGWHASYSCAVSWLIHSPQDLGFTAMATITNHYNDRSV